MAKDPKTVRRFLKSVGKKLKKKGRPEYRTLLEMMRRDVPGTKELRSSDYFYYSNQLKKEKYAIDDEKVKEYFPLEKLTAGMFDLPDVVGG